jgi:hypothetical protein
VSGLPPEIPKVTIRKLSHRPHPFASTDARFPGCSDERKPAGAERGVDLAAPVRRRTLARLHAMLLGAEGGEPMLLGAEGGEPMLLGAEGGEPQCAAGSAVAAAAALRLLTQLAQRHHHCLPLLCTTGLLDALLEVLAARTRDAEHATTVDAGRRSRR